MLKNKTGRPPKHYDKLLQVWLPKAVDDELRAAALNLGLDKSGIVRLILRDGISRLLDKPLDFVRLLEPAPSDD